jgi:signal transduction histidine kinase
MTRAGREIRVDLSLVALQASAPGAHYVMAMLRDAADRRRAEIQTLESARAAAARTEAEVALREVSQLLSDGIESLSRPIAKLQRSAARLARDLGDADTGPESGRAAQRGGLETSRVAQRAGLETGREARRAGPETGPVAQRAGPVAGPVARQAAPETGRAAQRGGPEAGRVAQQAGLETGRVARRVRVIERRAEAARRAAEQLADRAAIQTGSLQLALDRVNLVPLLTRVVAAARLRAPSHKLTLAVPQGLTAMVDPLRLEQVLTELIDQAIRRTPRGCWIDIDLRRPLAGQARLEVRDYSRPIARETREALLDRLGPEPALHVCRAIAEAHGGSLTAEHPSDGGLRLIATLPAQRGRLPSANGG